MKETRFSLYVSENIFVFRLPLCLKLRFALILRADTSQELKAGEQTLLNKHCFVNHKTNGNTIGENA
jgi:hypothetical protein